MRRALLDELRCPYCQNSFRLSRDVEGTSDRIEYGLVRCQCFEFPVVEGILLLSLAKGYGGAQEELQPYVPLFVAAVDSLGRDDVSGLRNWIARHIPLGAAVMDGRIASYLDFAAAYEHTLQQEVARFLAREARFEVVGDVTARTQLARLVPGASSTLLDGLHDLRARLHNLRLRRRIGREPAAFARSLLRKYYVQRFFCPRAHATSLHLRHLPTRGRLLSLCSGHGVFESWLAFAGTHPATLVCIEGQFLNLLVMRHLIGVEADLVCHDVQFDLPFGDETFDGVFSSTCLPEIPPQAHFIREAVRVTAPTGWTCFDSIWALDSGVERIDRKRYYRFSQNFLEQPTDYLPLFRSIARERRLGFDVSAAPGEYVGGPRWTFDQEEARRRLEPATDTDLNVLVVSPAFEGFVPAPAIDWVTEERLFLSPAYELAQDAAELVRVPELARLHTRFASRDFPGLPDRIALPDLGPPGPLRALDLYCRGVAAALPPHFGGANRRLSAVLRTASPS